MATPDVYRVLLVDDNKDIHDDFIKVLKQKKIKSSLLGKTAALLGKQFMSRNLSEKNNRLIIDSAYQGKEAVEMVHQAIQAQEPYALAFIDIRMPPGIDGIETIKRIWEIDPRIEIVICTAYSDYNWEDISSQLMFNDGFLILKKPFDRIEIQQLAASLTNKWAAKNEVLLQVRELKKVKAHLETSLSILDATIEATAEGTIVINDDQDIVKYNQLFLDLFDISEHFVKSHKIDDIFKKIALRVDGNRQAFIKEMQATVKRPMLLSNARDLTFRNGTILNYSCHPLCVQGEVAGLVYSFRNITEEQKLTAQLRKTNQALEEFAYVVSHDLKAPLRAVERLSSWISEDCADKIDDKSKENLALLRQRIIFMSNLIDGILEYSRAGRVDLDVSMVNTKALLQELIGNINPDGKFNIHLADDLPCIKTAKIPLTQVFSNLISNSIKHHHQTTGTIEIGVRDLGNSYEFFVADDGPGIEPEYHDKVFMIFQTLQSKDVLKTSGIGLSIVKKIVELQGGKISVGSVKGRGATFQFTWPKSNRDLA